jgi:cell division protein FtsW
VGEELGLIAAGGILILFALLLWLGLKIILRIKDLFAQLLGVGIVTMITLQAAINVAVCIGMLPTKGLPLPFISYGGSNLLINMMAIGLLLNISHKRYAEAQI